MSKPARIRQAISPHDGLEMLYKEAKKGASTFQIKELKAAKETIGGTTLPIGDAIKSFERAADAIKNGIRIFISYKTIHAKAASAFKNMLQAYGGGRIAHDPQAIFLAEQGVEPGKPFRKEILEAIKKAHWFFLLLSDVQFGRDWQGHEAGYFERGMADSERLICIHHKSVALADQLKDYQAYESTAEGLQQLFNRLFFEDQAIPGMNKIFFTNDKKKIEHDTEELAREFVKSIKTYPDVFGRSVDIAHKQEIRYDTPNDLLLAKIVDMKNLKEVFGFSDSWRGSFQELVSGIYDRQWIEELREALSAAVDKRSARTIEVPFLGVQKGWAFRPNLHCVWKYTESQEIDHFQVIFTEEAGQPQVPAGFAALETALRWSYRSWWEIYEQFGGALSKQDVEDIYRYSQRADQESQSRGVTDPKILLAAFDDPEDKKRLGEYFEKYFDKFRNPETKDGRLDRAFRELDPELMRECLDELKPMTLDFLKTAARRFAELIAKLK